MSMEREMLLSMSWWFERVRDLTIPATSVRLGSRVRRMLFEAYIAALDSDLNPVACLRIAGMLAEKHRRIFDPLTDAVGDAVSLYGAAFVRGNRASPKDACVHWFGYFEDAVKCGVSWVPGTQYNACLVSNSLTALALLLASERVIMVGDPSIVWIRPPRRLSNEMRLFIDGGVPRLVTWYYPEVPISDPRHAIALLKRYLELAKLAVDRLQVGSFTLDVAIEHYPRTRAVIVDIAPFPDRERNDVDTILFKESEFWKLLEEARERNEVVVRVSTRSGVEELAVSLEDLARE